MLAVVLHQKWKSNPEMLNFPNNGGFTLQPGAHIKFTGIAMNQVIKKKTIQKTNF